MVTLNRGTEPTFDGPRGTSHIDVTAATQGMLPRVINWEVQLGRLTTNSDHRIITWVVANGDGESSGEERMGWCAEKADWAKFARTLRDAEEELWEGLRRCDDELRLEGMAQEITEAISAACEAAMPARRRFPRSVPWWMPELTRLRADSRRKRKRYQREREARARLEKEEEYRQSKATYATRMEETKKEKWAEFCRESTTANPWGAVYRVLRGRRRTGIRETICTDEGWTRDARDTGEKLLERFFPEDKQEEDEQRHRATREEAESYLGNGEREPPITEVEVIRATRSMRRKKAPGRDGIRQRSQGWRWRPYQASWEVSTTGAWAWDSFPKYLRGRKWCRFRNPELREQGE